MNEELNTANASPGAEGAPPSPTPSPAEAPPAEQQPAQYLTRDEALTLIAERDQEWKQRYEELAREQGQRGAQSLIDKQRLNERVKSVEKMLNAQVQSGQLDPSQASEWLEQARAGAMYDLLTEEPEPQEPDEEFQSEQSRADQIAWHLINQSGLTQQDPEWQMILGHETFPTWHTALTKATAAKAARLARAQAAQNAAPPAPATPPPPGGGTNAAQPPAPTGAAAVEVGSGGGATVTDLPTLRQQYLAAQRKGKRKEANKLAEQIHTLTGTR